MIETSVNSYLNADLFMDAWQMTDFDE